ncbi:MAG: hypothetical protein ABIQ73_21370 [Acidimicrobiales bacterium]
MRKIWVLAILAVVGAGFAFRETLRNAMFATMNRGKVTLDRTGNRTNDIPSRRGELPVDLQ